jgi:hypothetical protein
MTKTNNAHHPQPYDVWRLAFYFEDKPDVVKERAELQQQNRPGSHRGCKSHKPCTTSRFPWRGAAEKLDAGRLAEAVRRSMLS